MDNNTFANNVNILGTNYSIKIMNGDSNEALGDNIGICEGYSKELILNSKFDNDKRCVANFNDLKKKVLRHEMIHAFTFESGMEQHDELDNELVVDWIAHQSPKMFISFLEAGAFNKDTLLAISDIINNKYDDDYNFKNQNNN